MAIAFFVPPEYGPPGPQPQLPAGQPGQNQNNQHPPIVDLHNRHFNNNTVSDVNNNNAPRVNPSYRNETSLVTLFSGFVHELLTVFGNRQVNNHGQENGRPVHQSRHSIRERRAAAHQLPNIRISNSDNHVSSLPLPDLIPSRSVIPDLLSCEAEMSIRYNSTTTTPATTTTSSARSEGRQLVAPLSPASSQVNPPSSSVDFEVSLKVSVGSTLSPTTTTTTTTVSENDHHQQAQLSLEESYRAVGAGLREIADSFVMSRRSVTRQSTFEFKIVISLALPSIAVVGLGLAYLRRSV